MPFSIVLRLTLRAWGLWKVENEEVDYLQSKVEYIASVTAAIRYGPLDLKWNALALLRDTIPCSTLSNTSTH